MHFTMPFIALFALAACAPADSAREAAACPEALGLEQAEPVSHTAFAWRELGEQLRDTVGTGLETNFDLVVPDREGWERQVEAWGVPDPIPQVDFDSWDVVVIAQVDSGCAEADWSVASVHSDGPERLVVAHRTRLAAGDEEACAQAWVDVLLIGVPEQDAPARDCTVCVEAL